MELLNEENRQVKHRGDLLHQSSDLIQFTRTCLAIRDRQDRRASY
jgi:hypothetical protein